MNASQRIVTRLPLYELWDDRGAIPTTRLRDLTTADIRQLLQLGAVRFVVADVGNKLIWVPDDECFAFWKSEVQSHLVTPGDHINLDRFPGAYCYLASEWRVGDATVIVLERHH